jgi:septum formation topological specificity factor MinE
MYNQTIENKKIDSYMEKIRQEIIKFIEKNSKYSESYVSIDFSEYSQSESGNGKN